MADVNTADPISLEVFKHRFAAIAEEMGEVLRTASFSPNIKERRDYSCAIFGPHGEMVAQAAHIPVHLGSMPLSVLEAIRRFTLEEAGEAALQLSPGDMVLLNDPYSGGTHLPDITLIAPVFRQISPGDPAPRLIGYVANRAHHADVGGTFPGSMGVSREIYQEGLIIPPVKLVERGELNESYWQLILANVRTPEERNGDLRAQISANLRGAGRLLELVSSYGEAEVSRYMAALLTYSERMTRQLLSQLPDGEYRFTDYLDDDGAGASQIPIQVCVRIRGDRAVVDFDGSAPQQTGSVNAVYAITLSAVFYVFRCLIGLDIPNNSGCLAPIEVHVPEGSVVNARPPAPVAGGNVETVQRIVDVLLGALADACPDRVPAASQGTMNNVTIGGWDSFRGQPFTYYETIGGGMGARPDKPGASGVHSHMTNTLNTPVEALEFAYPLRVVRYEIRRGSGGAGRFPGGDGIRRDLEVLAEVRATLLTERRVTRPYGLAGGEAGQPGRNVLIRRGAKRHLPGKTSVLLKPGDILSIRTPGGGGFGPSSSTDTTG